MFLKPLSKSTYQNFLLCPWAAHAFKNLGIESETSDAAQLGVDAHALIAEVLLNNVAEASIDIFAKSEEVAELTKSALDFPRPTDSDGNPAQYFVEQKIMADKHGKITDLRSEAIIHGFEDLLWRFDADAAFVRDWKSGLWEKINKPESHLYAVLCRAFFPGVTKVSFELCFLRSGNMYTTVYEWRDGGKTCEIEYPDGTGEVLYSDYDPILEYWNVRIKQIEDTPCVPVPGNHCTRWYGKPCQFLNRGCPLNEIDPREQSDLPVSFKGPEYTKALASIIKDEQITVETASNGLYAIHRMEEYLKYAKQRIMDWSKDNGPITIGTSKYGWTNRVAHEVDRVFAIETLMENGVPIEDWPINISKSSISKLPKRKYREVRELLDTFAVYPSSAVPQFKELNTKTKGD